MCASIRALSLVIPKSTSLKRTEPAGSVALELQIICSHFLSYAPALKTPTNLPLTPSHRCRERTRAAHCCCTGSQSWRNASGPAVRCPNLSGDGRGARVSPDSKQGINGFSDRGHAQRRVVRISTHRLSEVQARRRYARGSNIR